MILTVSRFKARPGNEQELREAFRQRSRHLDNVPGLIGMETFADRTDSCVFHRVARWTDREAFENWISSRVSHELIPKGCEAADVMVLDRLEDSAEDGWLEKSAFNGAPLISRYLEKTRLAIYVVANREGTILFCDRAMAVHFSGNPVGSSIWAELTDDSERELRAAITGGERHIDEALLLTFRESETFECRVDVHPDGFVLIGEPLYREQRKIRDQMVQLNNELTVLTRNLARKARTLEGELQEPLRIISEYLARLHSRCGGRDEESERLILQAEAVLERLLEGARI